MAYNKLLDQMLLVMKGTEQAVHATQLSRAPMFCV